MLSVMAEGKGIGFIGSGNIAQAIVVGAIKAGTLQASQIKTSAPSDRNFSIMKEHNVGTTHDNREVAKFADIIFLACKPYQIQDVATEILPDLSAEKHLVISCAAGLPMTNLESYLPPNTRVIRIIPNVACSVQEGGVVMVQGTHATTEDVNTVRAIFKGVAQCFEVPDRLVESASGILGCGVAYMAMVAEALSDGGVMVGLQRRDAIQMAAQLLIMNADQCMKRANVERGEQFVEGCKLEIVPSIGDKLVEQGTGKLLQETGKHPGEVKDSVCSPNGTTIRGVQALEKGGLRASLMDAVEATVKRAEAVRPK